MIPDSLVRDLENLQNRGFLYDVVESGCKVYVLFKEFPLPPNLYNMKKTDLLIFTTPHYPNANFDMFWTDPSLTLHDGRIPQSADVEECHVGKNWRRFSYHPYDSIPWNPSKDNVESYVEYVQQRLRNGD